MNDDILELPVGEWFNVTGRGRAMTGTLPITIGGQGAGNGLVGRTARVAGVLYRITGLELYMHSPPWHEGEKCSFLLDPLPCEGGL